MCFFFFHDLVWFLQVFFSSSSITTRAAACTVSELWGREASWTSPWVSSEFYLRWETFKSFELQNHLEQRVEGGVGVKVRDGDGRYCAGQGGHFDTSVVLRTETSCVCVCVLYIK